MGRYGWRNEDGVATVLTGVMEMHARCAAPCRWSRSGYGWPDEQNVRQAARRHAARFGHQVFFHKTRLYVYGKDET